MMQGFVSAHTSSTVCAEEILLSMPFDSNILTTGIVISWKEINLFMIDSSATKNKSQVTFVQQ